ncbi:MAG: tetraacyldisaccharide 4'-kinase [Bacteroides sp.]|nr:tetraacyldisaccharide 4'-kinase [Bacteroides sp.]
MESSLINIHESLRPLSWLYGTGIWMRNSFFDWGILPSQSFPAPVICIGNITVGGTGKTPHTEYLVRLLSEKYKVAVLSRGYKRRSKGFHLADEQTPEKMIGDEPWQMKQKFPDIFVAVDADRRRGIKKLLSQTKPEAEVILLDDAYQHRYVQAGINILLTDYNRLICDDELLPAGRLREPINGKNRAHIVIVTKCPADIKPMDIRVISKRLELYPFQQLYFTSLQYGEIEPLFPEECESPVLLTDIDKDTEILLLTGIASPAQMINDLQTYSQHIHPVSYPDHHRFTSKDLRHIRETFDKLPEKKLIITTEKDAARLLQMQDIDPEIKKNIYKLPIEITFLQQQQENFDKHILGYIRSNKRHNILEK